MMPGSEKKEQVAWNTKKVYTALDDNELGMNVTFRSFEKPDIKNNHRKGKSLTENISQQIFISGW